MAKKVYVGVDSVARKVKKMYVGVDNFTKRTLPSGYTQVEYIESSGAQYIDTGYKATSENYRIKCKFVVTNSAANTVLFGGGASTDIISALLETTTQLKFYVGSGSVSGASAPIAQGEEYEMECHANGGTLTVNLNGTTYSGSYQGEINKDYPLAIFSNYGSGSASMFSSVRLKTFQIYDNGTLVRDYVPATNSNGVGGLLDVKNGTFYTNAGTGDFTMGSTQRSVARKIKKGYIGVGGVARPFWTGGILGYYGTATEMSVGRELCGTATIGNYALFAGGNAVGSRGGQVATVDAYNRSLTRSTPTALSVARTNVAGATVGGYALFAGGGYGSSSGNYDTVDAYDAALTRTAPNDPLSKASYSLSSTSVGGYALFAGGQASAAGYSTGNAAYDSSLTRTTISLSGSYYNRAAVTIGNHALFGGGKKSTTYYANVDSFDTSLTMEPQTALSAKRYSPSAANAGSYALFAGGRGSATSTQVAVDSYDEALTMETITPMTYGRYGMASASLGGYAIFGGTESGEGITAVESYDKSLTLKTEAPLSFVRVCPRAAVIGDYVLFGGGAYDVPLESGTGYTQAYTGIVDVYTV